MRLFVCWYSNGVYYKLDMYLDDAIGRKRLMNKHEIKDRIELIWQETKGI